MSVIYTAVVRIADWKAWQRLSDETLLSYARDAGATRYRVFRNLHDAAEALLIAEFPDYEAVRRMGEDTDAQIIPLAAEGAAGDRVWELVDCAGID
jgi:hypothetical protein